MPDPESPTQRNEFVQNALEATIRIGLLLGLVAWCYQIVRPFVAPALWGVVIAISTRAFYRRLTELTNGRRAVASVLYVGIGLVLVVGPILALTGTLVEGVQMLSAAVGRGELKVPPPPAEVADWPLVGTPLASFWALASSNMQEALRSVDSQIAAVGKWLVGAVAGVGLDILLFALAIVVAGVLQANAEAGQRSARAVATRLAGARGPELADLCKATVRSVTRGILGVALIQSLLAGVGLLAAGVPGAGLLALLCLLLAVVQLSPLLILLPAAAWLFSVGDMLPFGAFLVWSLFVGVLDNILKPILLGRGLDVPMLIIFVGAIGGFLANGIIGLFLGSVVLAVSYRLFLTWLGPEPPAAV
jgi:predicted PurR-regulated permease PerM